MPHEVLLGGKRAGQVSVPGRSHSVGRPRGKHKVRVLLAVHKDTTKTARYRAPSAKLPPGRGLGSRNSAALLLEVQNRM